jgi:hypothetical protein
MRKIFLVSAMLILNSCVPDMAPPKTIMKSVKVDDVEVEWYSRSSAYVDVPDIVAITKGNRTDTICRASNVADLKIIGNDTILVGFYGKPKQPVDIIQLPQKVLNFNIVTDTTYVFKYKTKV